MCSRLRVSIFSAVAPFASRNMNFQDPGSKTRTAKVVHLNVPLSILLAWPSDSLKDLKPASPKTRV